MGGPTNPGGRWLVSPCFLVGEDIEHDLMAVEVDRAGLLPEPSEEGISAVRARR